MLNKKVLKTLGNTIAIDKTLGNTTVVEFCFWLNFESKNDPNFLYQIEFLSYDIYLLCPKNLKSCINQEKITWIYCKIRDLFTQRYYVVAVTQIIYNSCSESKYTY